MKSSASESKPVHRRSSRLSPKERLSRSKLKQPFATDSETEFFMYVIQGSAQQKKINDPRSEIAIQEIE